MLLLLVGASLDNVVHATRQREQAGLGGARIAVDTTCLLRTTTGIEHTTAALVAGLVDRGLQPVCLQPWAPGSHRIPGTHRVHWRRRLPIPFYDRLAAFGRFRFTHCADLLHLPTPQFPFYTKPDVPLVVTVHDLIPTEHPEYAHPRRVIWFKRFLPRLLRHADRIVAVSDATARSIASSYPELEHRVRTVAPPLSLDVQAPPEGVPPQEYMMHVGTLEPRKNLAGTIEALGLLRQEGLDIPLRVVGGRGWGRVDPDAIAAQHGVADLVRWDGYVPTEQLRGMLGSARALVWPSHCEGFGIPPLEAMAQGCPVITSDRAPMRDVVQGAAALVDPSSPHAIARAMADVWHNDSLAATMRRQGHRVARRWASRDAITPIIETYQEILP